MSVKTQHSKKMLNENSSSKNRQTFPKLCTDLFGPIWGLLGLAEMPLLQIEWLPEFLGFRGK